MSTSSNSHSVKKAFCPKDLLKIIVPVVAVLLVGAVVLFVISSSSNAGTFCYVRDNELFLSYYTAGAGEQVTANFVENNVSYGNINDYTRISNDGKKLFFVDRYDGTSYNLYYKNTDNMITAPKKISSDINVYDINDKGTVVTYTKDDGDLFQHNLTEQSDKIDKDVLSFLVSDNGKTVIYQKEHDSSNTYLFDLYISKSGEKGKQLITGIESVRYVSDDLSTVYYISDGALYKLVVGKNPKKLADNVRDVVKVYESGEVYFTKANDNNATSLYFYDGSKTSSSIIDDYYRTEALATDTPIILVFNNSADSYAYSVVIKNKYYPIEYNVSSIGMDTSGKEIYFTADFNSHTLLSTLYSAKIDGGIKNIKKISADVAQGKYLSGKKYVYVKDYDMSTSMGTVYLDDKEIGQNIYYNSIKYSESQDAILYFNEVDDDNCAQLNRYSKDKSEKINEAVLISSLSVSKDGSYVFLSDYKKDDGILYTYNGKRLVKIDHDVSEVVSIISNDDFDKSARANF